MSTTVDDPAPSAPPTDASPPPPMWTLKSSAVSHALGVLEEMGWLDEVGSRIDPVVAPVARNRALMDVLHGRWLGHALHPALSDLPIGCWSAVPLLDAAGEERAATLLTGAGCAAAVGAAVTGAADWTVTDGRERRLALLHGLANAAGLTLQLASIVARSAGARRAGRGLSLAGLGVTLAAAHIGGELTLGRGLMVDHTAWASGPEDWAPILDAADVPEGEARAAVVGGRRVLVACVDGEVCAMEDACSHAGGPLSEGTVEGGVVECPWHASRFRLRDGSVVAGPATFPQLRLESRVAGGRIEVRGRPG